MSKVLIDTTKPVVTEGGGFPARILCTDLAGDRPICVAVKYPNIPQELTYSVEPDGTYAFSRTYNIINVTEKRSSWVPVWEQRGVQYLTKEAAVDIGEGASQSDSPFIGLVEYKYEDDRLVDVVFHKES